MVAIERERRAQAIAATRHTVLLLVLLAVTAIGGLRSPISEWSQELLRPGARTLLYVRVLVLQWVWAGYVWLGVRHRDGLRALIDVSRLGGAAPVNRICAQCSSLRGNRLSRLSASSVPSYRRQRASCRDSAGSYVGQRSPDAPDRDGGVCLPAWAVPGWPRAVEEESPARHDRSRGNWSLGARCAKPVAPGHAHL